MELAYSQALDGATDTRTRGSGFLPLNRLETRNWDLLASLSGLGNPRALSSLRDKFRELTGRRHVFFAASCRAAIAQILRLLPHQEVVIPAYTCGVVKLAAQIAEKKILYADVARGGVNSTSAEFEPHARPGRVLIPTHLFGIPTDIENICELAKRRGCVTIEDAAASIAEPYGRGVLGTFSDFGVFSFERSKRFPAFQGAVIILNNESILDPEQLAQANTFGAEYVAPFQEIVSSLLYNIAGTPWIYGKYVVPRQLKMYAAWTPSSGSIRDEANSKFFKHEFHPYQATLVLRMLARMNEIRERIGQLISAYVEELRDSPVITFFPGENAPATLLRFPVAISGMKRAEVLRRTLESGLFLETNYERLLPDEISGNELANAQWTAENVFLLPLYTALSEREARRIAKQVVRIAQDMPLRIEQNTP
jgi:dTDP-4-amino-4,6-dideoxygalactose transaminase